MFLEKWLKEIFGKDTFSLLFAIERAHRVPSRVLPPGGQPRSLLFKMFNYKDKVTILQKAREMGNILHNGTRISMYLDFSPELQKQRAKFIEIH